MRAGHLGFAVLQCSKKISSSISGPGRSRKEKTQ